MHLGKTVRAIKFAGFTLSLVFLKGSFDRDTFEVRRRQRYYVLPYALQRRPCLSLWLKVLTTR